MVGDDIETDVLAAQRQGLTGALVKTGKYLSRTHRADRAEAPGLAARRGQRGVTLRGAQSPGA